MKKLLVCLFAIIGLCATAQIKNAGAYLRMVEPVVSDTLSASNDIVRVTFDYWPSNIFMDIKVENLTDNTIEIDWDKFMYVDGKTTMPIVFDNTIMAMANAPKGKTSIAPRTILRKKIAPQSHIENGTPLYHKKYLKYGPNKMTFIFPIERNGEITEFRCAVEAYLKK